jgi:hypothetical protein
MGHFPVNAFVRLWRKVNLHSLDSGLNLALENEKEFSLMEIRLLVLSAMLISIEGVSAIGCSSVHSHARGYPPQATADESLSAVSAPTSWHKVEAVAFWLFAPSGWEFHQLPGFDSYVGEFVGDGVVLRFDFGGYSGSCFSKAKKPAHVIAQESIGGLPAKIARPRTPGHGFTGIYFRNAGRSNGLCLWGQDLTSAQQEVALRIFETIRFERFEHLYVIPPPPARSKNPQ